MPKLKAKSFIKNCAELQEEVMHFYAKECYFAQGRHPEPLFRITFNDITKLEC